MHCSCLLLKANEPIHQRPRFKLSDCALDFDRAPQYPPTQGAAVLQPTTLALAALLGEVLYGALAAPLTGGKVCSEIVEDRPK